MSKEKKDSSWYDIWQNWMAPEAGEAKKEQDKEKDKIDDWYDTWSSWMAPETLSNKKDEDED